MQNDIAHYECEGHNSRSVIEKFPSHARLRGGNRQKFRKPWFVSSSAMWLGSRAHTGVSPRGCGEGYLTPHRSLDFEENLAAERKIWTSKGREGVWLLGRTPRRSARALPAPRLSLNLSEALDAIICDDSLTAQRTPT